MKPSLPSSRPLSALFRRGRKLFAGILLAATLGAFVFSDLRGQTALWFANDRGFQMTATRR
jgi:hypothetical protein